MQTASQEIGRGNAHPPGQLPLNCNFAFVSGWIDEVRSHAVDCSRRCRQRAARNPDRRASAPVNGAAGAGPGGVKKTLGKLESTCLKADLMSCGSAAGEGLLVNSVLHTQSVIGAVRRFPVKDSVAGSKTVLLIELPGHADSGSDVVLVNIQR